MSAVPKATLEKKPASENIFNRVKLRTKLIIAFFIIVLFVAGQSITTLQSTQETTDNFETIVDRSTPSINALDQMKAAEAAMVQEVVSFGLKRELGTLSGVSMVDNQELEQFQDNWRVMQESLESYQQTAAEIDDPARMTELQQASLNVYQTGLTYLTLSTQIDEAEILAPALDNLEAADGEFEVVLQSTLQNESDRLTDLSEISSQSVQDGLLLNVASSLALIITIVLVGVVVVLTVAKPLRTLESAARGIGEGDYSQRIQVNSRDEIGDLTLAFNAMADAIETRDKELHSLNDVLEKRIVEARESRDQADRANQAKSIFLSNMSHELRTPLNMVIGYTSSMLNMPQMYQGQNLPEIFREDVKLVQQNGQHLLSLINDLLDLSKIEAGKLELQQAAVDLDEIFKGVVASSLGLVGERPIQVRIDYPEKLPLVWADALRIRQILLNLMSNAIKFTKTGSVTLAATVANQKMQISVKDTGIGISQQAISTIFDRFQQVQQDSEIQGTGLGLDISQQLAIMHGSDIKIESTVGQGSTFSFLLPLATPEQIAEPSTSVEVSPGTATIFDDIDVDVELSQTILLVEDDSATRDMMRRVLENANYAVIDAHDGKLALDYARNLLPDLIILDIQLPDMSGWEILEEVKVDDQLKSIPVIVLSVDPEHSRAAEFGVLDSFVKPINPDTFLHRVSTLFNQPQVEKQGE